MCLVNKLFYWLASVHQVTPNPSHASQAGGAPTLSTLIYRPRSYFERLSFDAIFPVKQPIEVELGSGDGGFLAQYAKAVPEHNFLGVERLLGRLRKLDRKGLRAGLTNLLLLRIEAAYFVEYMLLPKSVRALHIYFPDPWPKRRHRKNRLINARFTELAAHVLPPGGAVYLRTDDADYFAQMTSAFEGNSKFRAIETPASLLGISTDFEREFHAKGTATLRAAYERVED